MKCSSTSSATTRATLRCIPNSRPIFRKHKPPFLAAWGKNDPFFFLPPGAEAFKRDIPEADVRFFRHRPFRPRDALRRDCCGNPQFPVRAPSDAREECPDLTRAWQGQLSPVLNNPATVPARARDRSSRSPFPCSLQRGLRKASELRRSDPVLATSVGTAIRQIVDARVLLTATRAPSLARKS